MKFRTWTACLAVTATFSLSTPPIVFAAASQNTSSQNISNQSTYATTIKLAGQEVLTVDHVVANDPSSGQPTSWISAMDMPRILQKLGIQAHWISGANQLVLNMPTGMTVPHYIRIPYHAPNSGYFVMIVNSQTVAYPPTLKQGNSTYLPVYYVMQALRKLGVTSQWTGATWDISAKAHAKPTASMSGDVRKTFPLTLTNGAQGGKGATASLAAPPVPAPAPVTVKLPMNPLLQSTKHPINQAGENLPVEDYVQTGRASYVVDKPIAAVEAWFKAAYTAQGFVMNGSGSIGSFQTGQNVQNQTFTPTKQQPRQHEQVEMSYEVTGDNQTSVEYWVTDVVVPARPKSSEIAKQATSMDVKMVTTTQGSNNASPTVTTYHVSNTQKINAVIDVINGLTSIDPPGVSGGSISAPMYRTTSDVTLVFHFRNGPTVTVNASKHGGRYGDVTVGKIPLTDSSGSVWQAVSQATQK